MAEKVALFGERGGGGGILEGASPYTAAGSGGEVGLEGNGAPGRREVSGEEGTAIAIALSIC
jgi:hypothetical protein